MIGQRSKIHGFCHHRVACPFSPLGVKVGRFKSHKNNESVSTEYLRLPQTVSREKMESPVLFTVPPQHLMHLIQEAQGNVPVFFMPRLAAKVLHLLFPSM